MFNKFVSFFNDDQPDLEFVDLSHGAYINNPPVLAKQIKPLKEAQEKQTGNYSFPFCPGIHDYSRLGYIIPAWDNFYLKANKAGSDAYVGTTDVKRKNIFNPPRTMETHITESLVQFNGVDPNIWLFPSPWRLIGKPGVTGVVMPAFFHNSKLNSNQLYSYPGSVDYTHFHQINFITSIKEKCEVIIEEGEPLLHIIPFITTKNFEATYYAVRDQEQEDRFARYKHYSVKNFYRKFFMHKKKFTLTKK